MPPPSTSPSLDLGIRADAFYLYQLPASASIPSTLLERLSDAGETGFLSVTRTKDEISIVSDTAIAGMGDKVSKWRCIQVVGPMDLGLTGIMCDLTTPLKTANIPIFALSTWNTDFLLVPLTEEKAAKVLQDDGWNVRAETE